MCLYDVPSTSQNGLSPLYAASGEGHTKVVEILLKNGADLEQNITVCDHFFVHSFQNFELPTV